MPSLKSPSSCNALHSRGPLALKRRQKQFTKRRPPYKSTALSRKLARVHSCARVRYLCRVNGSYDDDDDDCLPGVSLASHQSFSKRYATATKSSAMSHSTSRPHSAYVHLRAAFRLTIWQICGIRVSNMLKHRPTAVTSFDYRLCCTARERNSQSVG